MRALLALLAGCGRLGFDVVPGDGATTDGRLDDGGCILGPWTQPVPVTELDSPMNEFGVELRADGLEVIFQSERTGGMGSSDLWHATRGIPSGPFGMPTNLGLPNSGDFDANPTLSANGLTLYFTSARSGSARLYQSTRLDLTSAFGAATLVPGLESNYVDGAEITSDGKELFFDDVQPLMFIARTDGAGGFDNVVPVSELNMAYEGYPSLSPDGLTIYFESNRGASNDIYVAMRPDRQAPFETPVRLDDIDSPNDNDGDPEISADGLTLMFSRVVGGDGDLFASTRTCN